jgi:hypothetical protein
MYDIVKSGSWLEIEECAKLTKEWSWCMCMIFACKYLRADIVRSIHKCRGGLWEIGFEASHIYGNREIVDIFSHYDSSDLRNGLYYACLGRNMDVIDMMIENGANDWNRGLCGACEGGHIDLIDVMVDKGADDWNEGLYHASVNAHVDVVKMMIEKGATDWESGLNGVFDCVTREYIDTWSFDKVVNKKDQEYIVKLMLDNIENFVADMYDIIDLIHAKREDILYLYVVKDKQLYKDKDVINLAERYNWIDVLFRNAWICGNCYINRFISRDVFKVNVKVKIFDRNLFLN